MNGTRWFIVAGLTFVGLVLLLAVIAVAPLRIPVIALLALAVLVGGGNWLNSWLGIKRKPQEFNRPDLAPKEDEAP